MRNMPNHIVVIGGGITGLTAAYELNKRAARENRPLRVTLIEREPRLGGAVRTLRQDGFVIEQGPDSFLSRKPETLLLARELGLEEQLVGLNPDAARSYMYRNGRLQPLPEGLSMGIPTRVLPFLGTGLLSYRAKARAALDLVLRRRTALGDEPLGGLIGRRMGREVADGLVGPILAGIYAGDVHKLSTAATFPQLLSLESRHRSLILGMLASKRMPKSPVHGRTGPELPPRLRGSLFLTFSSGLGALVERLTEELVCQGTVIRQETSASAISPAGESGSAYRVTLSDGAELHADAVILAVPAHTAAMLLKGRSRSLNRCLASIQGVSVANVALGLDGRRLRAPLRGSGFVAPRGSGLRITACTWTSVKWPHTAPPGKLLLRAYLGHAGDEIHCGHGDDALTAAVLEDLGRILGEELRPDFSVVSRHPAAMPQYECGHLERLHGMESELLAQWPNVVLAGKSYRGTGMPDCIRQGMDAAEKIRLR
ncbi:protoporphyrinogen oxidase [Paenibacillus mucilaginosus]|uniref:Coproporphyrinogen III oxidase n=1 Tax=Paenibacillus mucilaginosus (strain KNP414) TaxID=1036673 RepID=F8F9I4_PAEMK|nr:protoporphyrinogen oxidase [Paenibacillus mucilaginosus]AEI43673.1 protoporphyrinogen oxidase [Paenibacillus mucilaginosus KNP414]MCG7216913.1 protoporphyrinogen oxidase [Paenibacillus mucilaginosus]WDM25200.1 protoporphyrinogen oxidase [Paenibacillus mucilaginosus]